MEQKDGLNPTPATPAASNPTPSSGAIFSGSSASPGATSGGTPNQPTLGRNRPFFSHHPAHTFSREMGDIVVGSTGQPKKSRKKGVIIGVVIASLMVIMGVVIAVSALEWPGRFKSDVKEYSQQYQSLIGSYSNVVNTELHKIEWEALADMDDELSLSIAELSNSISKMNPIGMDSSLVSQAKGVVSETSAIAHAADKSLHYLKTIYDTYISFCIPFIDDEMYFGKLPDPDFLVDGIETDDNFQESSERLTNFRDFMTAYQSNLHSLLVDYNSRSCGDNAALAECQQIQSRISQNHQTLVADWEQFMNTLYENVNSIITSNNDDPYKLDVLRNLESRLNV